MRPPDDPPAIIRTANHAAELKAAFDVFQEYGRKRLDQALVIGAILAGRKKAVGHGNWLKWLEAHFPYGRERAADFLRLHEGRGKCGRAATFEEALRIIAAAECGGQKAVGSEEGKCGRAATFEEPEGGGEGKCGRRPHLEGEESPPLGLKLPPVLRPPSPAKKGHPVYGKNTGDRPDLAEHRYGAILAAMRNLSRLITVALNEPDGGKLREHLYHLGLVNTRGFILNGKKYRDKFKGFMFRHAVKVAVGPKVWTKAELVNACLAEWENDHDLDDAVPE